MTLFLDLFKLPLQQSTVNSLSLEQRSLSTIKNEIDTKLDQMKNMIDFLEDQNHKIVPPLLQHTNNSNTNSASSIFSEGGIAKKLKLKIKPPTLNLTDPSTHCGKKLPRVGYGVKNLARAKELSRLQSSTLKTSTASGEYAKQLENQIPVNFFWSMVEPYFAPITENDLKFLKNKELEESLFIIPRRSQQRSQSTLTNSPKEISIPDMVLGENCNNFIGTKSFHSETNFKLLSMRIITLLVEENLMNIEEEQELLCSSSNVSPTIPNGFGLDSGDEEQLGHKINGNISLENIPDLQNRIMQELSFVNLPKFDRLDSSEQLNVVDESFRELKCLHYCLRTMHAVNCRRKEILLSLLRARMASLEYYSILDELDKQIEHIYTKKYKVMKKKKLNLSVDISSECPELEGLLTKRAVLVKNFAAIVIPRNQTSVPLSNDLFLDAGEEKRIASRFEIPSLSDEETRQLFGINRIVDESNVIVWPNAHNEDCSSSSESISNKDV